MEALFEFLKRELAVRDVVLVTVIAAIDSAPRKAGAKMLVTAAGRVSGTVGGGAVEHEACRIAQDVLAQQRCRLHRFALHPGAEEDIGMVCGGEQSLFFQYLRQGDADALTAADAALNAIREAKPAWLITDEETGQMRVFGEEPGVPDRPARVTYGGRACFAEPLQSPGILYIFGGGHVAQELVPIASRVGFRCIVLDDRPEYANAVLFPGAIAAKLVDFNQIGDAVAIRPCDYVAIMTRGHRYDSAVEAQVLKSGARYIGIMGSKTKKAFVEAQMRALGFSDAELSRVRTPIGLAIKAETPAEIAVSIVAQLIQVRASATPADGNIPFDHSIL